MNKKSILALSFAAFAIVSGYAGIKAFRSQACCENDLLAQNIEALSEDEGTPIADFYIRGGNGENEWHKECNPETRHDLIFNCPSEDVCGKFNSRGTCKK